MTRVLDYAYSCLTGQCGFMLWGARCVRGRTFAQAALVNVLSSTRSGAAHFQPKQDIA